MSTKFTFTFPAIITSYDPKVHKSFKAYIDHLKANIGDRFNAKTNLKFSAYREIGSQYHIDDYDIRKIENFIRDSKMANSVVNDILQFCIEYDNKNRNDRNLYVTNDLIKLYGGRITADTVKMYLEFAQQINLDELEVNDCLIAGIAKIPKKESETKQEFNLATAFESTFRSNIINNLLGNSEDQEADNASIAELQNRIKEAEQNFNASEKEKGELEIKYKSLQNRHAEVMTLLNLPTTQSIITG